MAVLPVDTEQFGRMMQEEKLVLLEFWAPWCVYCRRIASALEQVAEQYAASLIVGQINIDAEPQLAENERIEVVPTFVLYRNGTAVGSLVAPDSKAGIEAFLREKGNR